MTDSGASRVAAALRWLGAAPEFNQAVLVLDAATGRRPTGTLGPPGEEALRFRSTPSLGFPAADITSIELGPGPWPIEMEISFLGLYGSASPLPPAWSERIAQQDPGAPNLRDLLDLFGHPLVGLLWRGWRQARPHLCWSGDAGDVPSVAALALGGMMPQPARPDAALDPVRLLPLAGLLAERGRGAAALGAVLSGYLEVPATVEEWLPRRVAIASDQLCSLGSQPASLGAAVIGEAVRDVSGHARVVLGPMRLNLFVALLPGGARRPALVALLRLAAPAQVQVEVELRLAADERAGATLGATRLGFTSWIGAEGQEHACPTGAA